MKVHSIHKTMLAILLFCWFSVCLANETPDPNESSKYLDAVRTFADNVLKYGRDTYGPKHTPLFVDGLNVHTHEPVKWIAPNGDRWILSNLASQQNLFRTLDGLTKITGDPKYKQAAMEAIEYAFENLQTPNGLLYCGRVSAYDANADKACGGTMHSFKLHYPYYELMWEVNPGATKEFIEAFWSTHILDWSNLDMNRVGPMNKLQVSKGWDNKYTRGPVFFESKVGAGRSFMDAGSDLFYAAAILSRLSGDKRPLIWAKRLAYRYVETRDIKIGIAGYVYTRGRVPLKYPFGDDFKGNPVLFGTLFPVQPGIGNSAVHQWLLGELIVSPGVVGDVLICPWICQFLLGETLGADGKEFTQWAFEELTAWGKVAYREKDNSFIPMLIDGTSLEGYVCKKDSQFGPKGTVFTSIPAVSMDFWAYALAYRFTEDPFMWEMARNIALGNNYGEIGASTAHQPQLRMGTDCSDPYTLLGFLELYRSTRIKAFLYIAERIGSNILADHLYKGFFLPSHKHIYAKFDTIESIVLLHLYQELSAKSSRLPQIWPNRPSFTFNYRNKESVVDNRVIYNLTGSSESPRSLQEVAACGEIDEIKLLLSKGIDINGREDTSLTTALHRAVINGREAVVKLLLAEGADVDARDSYAASTLHYAVEKDHIEIAKLLITRCADVNATNNVGDTPLYFATRAGHKDIVELLIANGADVNAKNNDGQTPLDIAISRNRKEIVELLIAKGAEVSSIHSAAYLGDVAKVKSFIEQGSDVNAKDRRGLTPLHYAAREGYKEIVEILLAHGAEVNIGANNKRTAAEFAMEGNHDEVIELLVSKGADISPLHMALYMEDQNKARVLIEKGADVNKRTPYGTTPLDRAVYAGFKDIAELLIAKGADVNAKDNWGWTPLHSAVYSSKDMVEMLLAKGADVAARTGSGRTPLWYAQYEGYTEIVELLRKHGAKEEEARQEEESPVVPPADINKKADTYQMPLHKAAAEADLERVKSMISGGAEVNVESNEGWTALHRAAVFGHADVVKFFLGHGADVNTVNRWGWMPLHSAALYGHKAVVALLLANGADISAKTPSGETPVQIAIERGYKEIAGLLHKHEVKD